MLKKLLFIGLCFLIAATANARCIREIFIFEPALTIAEAKAVIVKLRGVKNWQKESEDLKCKTFTGGVFRAVFYYAPNPVPPDANEDVNFLYDSTRIKTIEISFLPGN